MRAQDEFLRLPPMVKRKKAVVIVAVKGVSPTLEFFYRTLLNQDYPDYRVIFTFESAKDPARRLLNEVMVEGLLGAPVENIVAGLSENCGQKVHNQIAAMKRVREEDEVIVFADADMRCKLDWLSRLVAPINAKTHDLSTTYRWFIPQQTDLPNVLLSTLNASIATLGGPEWLNLLWGGSMAISRDAYDTIDVPTHFEGALNDDVHLAMAAKRGGYQIAYIRSLMMPTEIQYTWSSLFEFGRRQYFQGKVYAPWVLAGAILLTGGYVLASMTAWLSVLTGQWSVLLLIAVIGILNYLRAQERIGLIHELMHGEDLKLLRSTFVVERFGTFFYMYLNLLLALSALPKRTIRWAGIHYRVRGVKDCEVLGRAPIAEEVPKSSAGAAESESNRQTA